VKEAKYRLIFEELLFLQTGLLSIKRKMTEKEQGIRFFLRYQDKRLYAWAALPSDFRPETRVLSEINSDMESSKA
jgi:ATP-dependent DNA helicase RecG